MVFNSPDAYRDIYNNKANVTRSKTYEIWQRAENDINTLNTSDVTLHRSKRRLLNLVFTEKSLRSAEEFVISHVDRWNELMPGDDAKPGQWTAPRNFADWSDCLTFDIMGDLSFGAQFDTKEPGENKFRSIPSAIHQYMKFNYPVSTCFGGLSSYTGVTMLTLLQIIKSPIVPLLLWAKPRGLNRVLDAITPPDIKQYYSFIEDSIAKRQEASRVAKEKNEKSAKAREDMLYYLCEARHPDTGGPAYSEQELIAEANLLIIAGSDTTSINLCGFFFYITHNERIYRKLISEIRTTFSSADEIRQGTRLASCIYLKACLDESMRLTPAGPSELGRLVLPGGQMVNGEFYPEGCEVGWSMWCSGRHDEIGDPSVYRPERWIPDEHTGVTEEDVRKVRSFVHPFITGPGNCVGQNLAMQEMLITIGRTLWRFDVRVAPGTTHGEGRPELGWGRRDRNQYMLLDMYTSGRDGPILQFRRRERSG